MVSAQTPAPETYAGDFWTRPRLTGDWGGFRDQMAKRGVALDVDWLQTLQGVMSGGKDQDAGYWGTFEYTLSLDSQKMGLWPGAFLTAYGMSSYGSTVLKDSGALIPVNLAGILPAVAVDEPASALMQLTFAQFRVNATLLNAPISAWGGTLIFIPMEGSLVTLGVLDPNGTPLDNSRPEPRPPDRAARRQEDGQLERRPQGRRHRGDRRRARLRALLKGQPPIMTRRNDPVKRLVRTPLALALAALLGGCASTGTAPATTTTLDKIKSTKTILLGYRDSSVPFSFADQSRAPAGYQVDLCRRVVEDLRRDLKLPDLEPKWVPVTVESRMGAVTSGAIDVECGSTTNTLSRQEQVDFSLTTFITGASLLALSGRDISEIGGIRIAVIPGTTTDQIIKDGIARGGAGASQAQLLAVKDHAEGLAALVNRTADVYATDRAILIGLVLSTPDPQRFALLDRFLSYEPYALMIRRGDPAFRLAVNRSLARLYRSGDIMEIYRKWFGQWGPPSALTIGMYAIEGLPE